MSLTIRERCSAVFKCLQEEGVKSIRAISEATGLSKSSVGRHKQAIARRAQYPESSWWETEVGGDWLKLFVLGVVYYFGIKQGIGAESLEEFFKAMRLEGHVACSATTWRSLKKKIGEAIVAYGMTQAEHCQPSAGQGICVGADETFFGLPILVMVELSSGYIFTEVESDNRTYSNWLEQIQSWWMQGEWHCHFMVSDGAKALIKLALEGLGAPSVADLFHALRSLGQPLGSAIGRHGGQLRKKYSQLSEQLAKTTEQLKSVELQEALEQLSVQQQRLEVDRKTYHQTLHAITQAIHPFDLTSGHWQLLQDLSTSLSAPLQQMRSLAMRYGTNKAQSAIDTFERQIPSFGQGIHAWWRWVTQALNAKTSDLQVQQWVLGSLLPWTYWKQQANKTKHCELKLAYQRAEAQAKDRLGAHPFTSSLETEVYQKWVSWADWICTKYQRTSSAVEGRNGYLSRLHHTSRGFSPQSLAVLTLIHNFDIRRADGTTAAERLFGQSFENLFEWVVDYMGDIPVPRQSSSKQLSNPLPRRTVPA